MNKLNFKYLSVGQKIKVRVVEVESGWIIVSFKGQLLRVENRTDKEFECDKSLYLIIKKVSPLKFVIPSENSFNVWA